MGRQSSMFSPQSSSGLHYLKLVVALCGFFLLVHVLLSDHHVVSSSTPISSHTISRPAPIHAKPPPKPEAQKPKPKHISNFVKHGSKNCLPSANIDFHEEAIAKKNTCQRYSPFQGGDARIATVSAQFGEAKEPYQKALKSHMLHSLIHGGEVHVMCDSIVDDLWNKPAFLLNLLLEQMLEPPEKRLEWIFWADRDTMILDQCRPLSSFLPPSQPAGLARRSEEEMKDSKEQEEQTPKTAEEKNEEDTKEYTNIQDEEENLEEVNDDATHLIIANDPNGLNNGAFFMRVNHWSIELLTAILGFRYFRPEVELAFTEQSAMEILLSEPRFQNNVAYVPQHWFNAFPKGEAHEFQDRTSDDELDDFQVRRGDYLVHFAGDGGREENLNAWWKVLKGSGDVWQDRRVQRDISAELQEFWEERGY